MAVEIDYSVGELGENYTPTTIEEMGNAIGKIAHQVIRSVDTKNPLDVFKKMPVDNGDTIEEAVVLLAEGTAYDRTGSGALQREVSEKMAVRYYKNWTPEMFKKTIDLSEIRKVLQTGKGTEEISAKIVASLTEGDKDAEYQYMKGLLDFAKTNTLIGKTDTLDLTGGDTLKDVLEMIKNFISGMKFVNTEFNKAGIRRKTKAEDIYLLMPYQIKNKIDVQELAGVFNLDKDKLDAHLIEIDNYDSDNNIANIYIVDKNALLDYTRLYEMLNELNANGRFWNYYLHTDRLYAFSQLFDSALISVTMAS